MSDFDHRIRERLEGHSAERPTDAWDRFAQRWPEDATAEDPAFDAFLRHKLEYFQVRHAESIRQHRWHELRLGMDLIRDRVRELWLAKSMEFSLAFLLCFYWWVPTGEAPLPSPVHPASEPMAELRSHGHDPLSGSGSIERSEARPVISRQFNPLDIPAIPLVPPDQPPAAAEMASDACAALIAMSEEDTHAQDPADQAGTVGAIGSDQAPVSASLSLPALLPQRSTALQVDADLSLLDQASRHPSRRRYFHRVSMAVLGDLHYVMTPYDHLLIKRGYDQLASGYGAAMGYTWEGRRWGLRAQLTYRHLYYLPKPYTEVFDGDVQRGYFTESIRNIELNLVSMGLQVSRQLATTGRWRWYALTGGSLHMAVLANYDRKQKYLPGSDPLLPGEIPQPQHPSRISQKRFADGFLEGGNMEENYYLSLDLGAGVERHLNGRVSLFAEPVYHHNPFQKSLGPNRDRLSTFTVFSGIRVLL
jgi:hypothetical protein